MNNPADLKVKLFADGADLDSIAALAKNPAIRGFTTNPTLMRKAGIADYETFARAVLVLVPDRPVSFEVFADAPAEMEAQATVIAGWGSNVNVKIPVTNTRGEFMGPLIQRLSARGIAVNVTALLTLDQVERVTAALNPTTPALVSVFAGRIADTGRDPVPLMSAAVDIMRSRPRAELIWASPREVLNVYQANTLGCHIITATPDLIQKLRFGGKDLAEFSLETVRMFYDDARKAGYIIRPPVPDPARD